MSIQSGEYRAKHIGTPHNVINDVHDSTSTVEVSTALFAVIYFSSLTYSITKAYYTPHDYSLTFLDKTAVSIAVYGAWGIIAWIGCKCALK